MPGPGKVEVDRVLEDIDSNPNLVTIAWRSGDDDRVGMHVQNSQGKGAREKNGVSKYTNGKR